MEARNVTLTQLEEAARTANVVLNYPTVKPVRKSTTGVAISFTLRPDASKQWQRLGHTGRKVHAVCWHGHRSFMRAAYALAPGMQLRSAQATYQNAEHFEQSHGATGDQNIGSQMQPLAYREACTCGGY